MATVLALYRRAFWWLRSWFPESEIAIGGTSPWATRMREQLEREEQRRERRLRRFRLLPPEQPSDDGP